MNYALRLITSRRLNMEIKVVFFTLLHFLLVSSGAAEPSIVPNNLVTQTVYGFLDFTTTIGNTVMIFSPQSSAVKKIDPITTPPPPKKEVIEIKPPNLITTSPIDIKPSKIVKVVENKPTEPLEKIVTVVNVISESSKLSDNKITKPLPFSEVNVIKASTENVVKTPLIISSRVEVVEAATTKLPPGIISKVEFLSSPVSPSKIDIIANKDDSVPDVGDSSLIFGNNIGEPEYEFLSRQPSEVVEETYKVINFKPASSKFVLKPRQSNDHKHKATTKKNNSIHPTGLVTKLGGTIVKDGSTIVHETSVIGTYISGKYAQVLQSSSRVLGSSPKGKISPSQTLRILKTAAPSHKGGKHRNLEPTPAASINVETAVDGGQHNTIKSSKKTGGQKRFKNRINEESTTNKDENKERSSQSSKKKTSNNRSNARSSKKHTTHRTNKSGRGNRKTTTTTPSSVHSDDESSFPTTRKYQSNGGRRNKQNRSNPPESAINNSNSNGGGFSRRAYKPKVQTSSVEAGASSKLYKFKLNRSPGRWQYKTTPKPRVTIRKQNNHSTEEDEYKNETSSLSAPALKPSSDSSSLSNEVAAQQSRQQDESDGLEGSESVASIIDDDGPIENKLDAPSFPLETIKVEISTPPDFKDIYYEIATIKSPYTFQVGSVKNTRFITVTSTFEKSLINTEEPTLSPTPSAPLTENILATSSNYDKDNNFLDSSIATLPPIYLESDMETPPLETVTETFSTTETLLKTHILPIIRSPNDTATSSLIQTYLVTRLVTATKTKPPMEAYDFIPSKTLKDFNSHLDEAGSELHLELEFGDQNEQDDGVPKRVFPPDIDLSDIGSKFDLSDVDRNKIPEGHLRLKKAHSSTLKNQLLPDFNPASNLSPEQLQQLALLRLLNPAAALQQPQVITTSKPVIRIETLYESHVIPITNGPHTFSTTLSKVIGTVTKTEFEYSTSTLSPGLQQPFQFPQAPINPLFPQVPQAQPQFTVTSSPIIQTTTVTETRSKVLKITFGAKTAYTTVISSTVVPTVLTTYVTSSVAVQPTAAAFPGFFPAPYPPYPYVG